MTVFDKWLFLRNVQTNVIDNIHIKHGMYVFDKKFNQPFEISRETAILKIQ